jgi:hypothetical protein
LPVPVVAASVPARAPIIAALEPAAIRAGAGHAVVVRVLGAHFVAGTTARWSGAGRLTMVADATELRPTLPAPISTRTTSRRRGPPRWTPDGARVALRRVVRATGVSRIVTPDAATGTSSVWGPDLQGTGLPAYAPDGRWLAVSSPTLFAGGGSARAVLAPTVPGTAATQVRWSRRP